MFDAQPLRKKLSGLKLEYRIVQLYSRDAGKREAKHPLQRRPGHAGPRISQRSRTCSLTACRPAKSPSTCATKTTSPTTAAFVIRDAQGRVYPSPAKRLAPGLCLSSADLPRRRRDGCELPDGEYTGRVLARAGVDHADADSSRSGRARPSLHFKVERWIDPSKFGWWSGDHHIHAAGCAHYTKPTEGVHAAGHDAALPGRRSQGRLQPDLGALLRLSKAILHAARTTRSPNIPTCCTTTSKSPGSARINPGICACCA